MTNKSFEFQFTEKQLIALQDAAANHVNPWDEEDKTLEDLAAKFAQALKAR